MTKSNRQSRTYVYCSYRDGERHHERGYHDSCPGCDGSGFKLVDVSHGDDHLSLAQILAWREAVIINFVDTENFSEDEGFFSLWFGALEDAIEELQLMHYGGRLKGGRRKKK